MAKDQKEKSGQTLESRRGFLKKLWIGLGFVALIEMAGLIVAYLRPKKQKPDAETLGRIITAGPADDFEKGSVTAFRRGQFYLIRLDDGGFMALSRKCTHLGCTVPWVASEKKFICPCHSSVFDINGAVLQSPAPRPLDVFAVMIENSIIKVDTNKKTKRSGFDKSQVVYL
ncbi:MAG: ubiquinol-cytochrome c reductase iron-sulfur subunit [Desulfobacteraceae bacterium]|nr:ubiquinol-cytochrome c reductase iron-sulfur subunit [Desulfobacteraceae bacterium]MBC2757870.1 ubiquinol-cytochrome c reductase iron-sulfur subunit [Desulfobacteraceae bacterium]